MMDASSEMPNLDLLDEADGREVEATFEKLARYCRLVRQAKRERINGYIEAALTLERQAEALYATFPNWARW